MADAPKLEAYMVALSFAEGGPIHCNAVIAPTPFAAAAMISVTFMQTTPTDKTLDGVVVAQLQPEFMRAALRAYEGTLDPNKPNVVSLVPPQPQSGAEPRSTGLWPGNVILPYQFSDTEPPDGA